MRYLVAIPVYNEERYLPGVIDAVRRYADDVLVINDGSTDRTSELLAERPDVESLSHPENRGYGQSLIDAFGWAYRRGYDWVITIDCDEQHEPRMIPRFVEEASRDTADVISGSRYLDDNPLDDPPPEDRRQINMAINELLARRLGLRLTDSFCGFKAHRVCAMQRLNLTEPGYAFPLQFWARCVQAGLRITEIPVRRIYRDRNRQFGGTLDDPEARLQHYLEVLRSEIGAAADAISSDPCLAETWCQ